MALELAERMGEGVLLFDKGDDSGDGINSTLTERQSSSDDVMLRPVPPEFRGGIGR